MNERHGSTGATTPFVLSQVLQVEIAIKDLRVIWVWTNLPVVRLTGKLNHGNYLDTSVREQPLDGRED